MSTTASVTSDFTKVTSLDDLWEGEMLPVTVDGVEVLLVHSTGQIAAFEDKCPHVANPLSTGTLDGDQLSCAAHQWTFDVRDGKGRNPATSCLKRFALQVVDDEVYVNVHQVEQEAQKGM